MLLFTLLFGAPSLASEHADAPVAVSPDAKVKVKKDTITADGVTVGTIRKEAGMPGSFTLVAADGTDLLFFKWIAEPMQYMEAYRAEDLDTLYFDAEADLAFKKIIATRLVQAGVLTAGAADTEALDTFAKKAGTEQTRLRNSM